MTDLPKIATKASIPVDVEEGKTYYWCSCGLSQTQPFCDGAHRGGDFKPEVYSATETKTVYFCGCKHSNKKPLCDGSHRGLD